MPSSQLKVSYHHSEARRLKGIRPYKVMCQLCGRELAREKNEPFTCSKCIKISTKVIVIDQAKVEVPPTSTQTKRLLTTYKPLSNAINTFIKKWRKNAQP